MFYASLHINIFDKIFYWIYARPFWQIILFILIAIILWAILGKIFAKKKVWQIINIIIVFGMTLAILYLTLFRRSTLENCGVLLSPLQNLEWLMASAKFPQTLYLNVFLFLPLGLSLPFALPNKLKNKVLITIIACFIFSVCIEIIQGALRLGDVEIFDLIANVLGAALGCLAYYICIWIQKKKE